MLTLLYSFNFYNWLRISDYKDGKAKCSPNEKSAEVLLYSPPLFLSERRGQGEKKPFKKALMVKYSVIFSKLFLPLPAEKDIRSCLIWRVKELKNLF
jgi:hypothetical protein